MTDERYAAVMADYSAKLTPAEIAEGWHFCVEFDGLLVGPGMGELRVCQQSGCWPADHKVYATIPDDQQELPIDVAF